MSNAHQAKNNAQHIGILNQALSHIFREPFNACVAYIERSDYFITSQVFTAGLSVCY
jgi:hypothetical protein